jgi:hypothetical protein
MSALGKIEMSACIASYSSGHEEEPGAGHDVGGRAGSLGGHPTGH